jgi:hypothetical protein
MLPLWISLSPALPRLIGDGIGDVHGETRLRYAAIESTVCQHQDCLTNNAVGDFSYSLSNLYCLLEVFSTIC